MELFFLMGLTTIDRISLFLGDIEVGSFYRRVLIMFIEVIGIVFLVERFLIGEELLVNLLATDLLMTSY